jgi:hypothetical protein
MFICSFGSRGGRGGVFALALSVAIIRDRAVMRGRAIMRGRVPTSSSKSNNAWFKKPLVYSHDLREANGRPLATVIIQNMPSIVTPLEAVARMPPITIMAVVVTIANLRPR